MNDVGKAVEQLARTLRHVPGVVRVHAEVKDGVASIVVVVAGRAGPGVGPGVWFGFPVRVVRGGV